MCASDARENVRTACNGGAGLVLGANDAVVVGYARAALWLPMLHLPSFQATQFPRASSVVIVDSLPPCTAAANESSTLERSTDREGLLVACSTSTSICT